MQKCAASLLSSMFELDLGFEVNSFDTDGTSLALTTNSSKINK